MHSLLPRLAKRSVPVNSLITPLINPPYAAAKRAPQLLHRQRKASYYFDASRHTAISFRLLLSQLKQSKASDNFRSTQNFLCLSIENLLQSIRPGLDDDEQSRQYFLCLLRMHLSPLSVDELNQLSDALKTAHFACNVAETVIDDELYREHGFANGPPHSATRTLMQTQDFFNLLDDLKDKAMALHHRPLPSSLSSAVRSALPACAIHWEQSEKTPEDLFHSVCLLGQALDLPVALTGVATKSLETKASTVAITQQILVIDNAMAQAMATDTKGTLFTEVLRDVLELLLTQKLFGIAASPDKLLLTQRQDLFAATEKIYASLPVSAEPALKAKARAALAEAHSFGQIHIQPTTGVALGHTWIASSLSLVPDKRQMSVGIGHRYMHSGFHLEPGDSHIREWPAHFMTAKENEEIYPDDHAWHLRVPVEAGRLQAAAQEVRREWESLNLPYRFTGTAPGMPATGCRVTVWEAVRRGMTADARAVFDHYNRGLPDPQSPTELWQRLDSLMQWMEMLAAD